MTNTLLTQNAHLIGGFLALLCLFGAFRSGRRRWLVQNLPRSKTTGVLNGLVELKGTAEADEPPLCSHLALRPCLYYKWVVEEKWACFTTEDGKITRDSGWDRVASGEQMIPFVLKDDSGSIRIHPRGAKIEPVVFFEKICNRNDPIYYSKGPAKALAHSKHERRFYEIGIPLHQELYVIGQAHELKGGVAAEIAQDSRSPVFLISAWTEDEIRKRFRSSSLKWIATGLAVLIAGLLGRDIQALEVINESWPTYVFFILGYLFAAELTREWMIWSAKGYVSNRAVRARA